MKKNKELYFNNILFTILIFITMLSCETPKSKITTIKDGYKIKEIEGCEYIEVTWCLGFNDGYYSLTHKGNCKYCKQK